VGTFFAVALWESHRAHRDLSFPAEQRWSRHALLLVITIAVELTAFRVGPIAFAAAAADNGFGILNKSWLPFLIQCAAGVLLLDLAHYAVHRMFHSVSFFWRVHEIHHSDPDYDVSTAARFHPLEVIASTAAVLAVIWVLAPPPVAVLVSVLLTVALNLFSHANASLPAGMDRMFRSVFVTPDMHRIHHSEEVSEQSSNFGQTFSWWDRMFGTYVCQPAAGDNIVTGLAGMRDERSLGFGHLLGEPFRSRDRANVGPVLKPDQVK
jgi:sterol desaturase/sphingolipid hydroxylase (fatty acid hydroxylase superfamily)